jgi:hypothetical protein
MKTSRIQIETSPYRVINSNLLTENLKIFSTNSSNMESSLKKKIFNDLINSKQYEKTIENTTKSKFDKFKLNMLIKERNIAISPQKVSSKRNLKNDDLQFLK